jgi:4-hydroxybenzoate polyprenyltransferase
MASLPASLPHPLLSRGFARGFLVTCRTYLCFVSGVSALAGLAGTRALSIGPFLALSAVGFAAYGFGQAVTDVTQTDTDALSSPYRPLVRGEVERRDVFVVAIGGLVVCAGILLALDARAALLAAVSAAGLLVYTPLKRRFWAGPIHNAWIVAALPCVMALADGRPMSVVLHDRILQATVAATFFGYITFVLLGYLKDVEADRATGYETLAVRFGRKTTAVVSTVAAVLSIVSAAIVALPAGAPVATALLVFGGARLLVGHARAWHVEQDREAHRAIVPALRGYVAIELAIAVAQRASFDMAAFVLLAAFELMLARRPCKEQV